MQFLHTVETTLKVATCSYVKTVYGGTLPYDHPVKL